MRKNECEYERVADNKQGRSSGSIGSSSSSSSIAAQDGCWRGRAGAFQSTSRSTRASYRVPVSCLPSFRKRWDAKCVSHGPSWEKVLVRVAEAAPCQFARLALVQHEPIGCLQHHIEALQARDTWSVWHRVDGKFDRAYGDALDGDVARSDGPPRAVGPSALWSAYEWAPRKLLGNPFMNYWCNTHTMLSNPLIRVHCKLPGSYCARGEGAQAVLGFG